MSSNNPLNYSSGEAYEALVSLVRAELVRVKDTLPDCYYMALVSVDGLTIAGEPEEVEAKAREEDIVGPMNAAMVSLGERISTDLGGGAYRLVTIIGKKGIQFSIPLRSDEMNELEFEWVLAFGVRNPNSIDAVLANLRQCWPPLLSLLNIHNPPPFFES